MIPYYKYTDEIEGNDEAVLVYTYAVAASCIAYEKDLSALVSTGVNFDNCSKLEARVLDAAVNGVRDVIHVDKTDLRKAITIITVNRQNMFTTPKKANADMGVVEIIGCSSEMIVFMKAMDSKKELYINVYNDVSSLLNK